MDGTAIRSATIPLAVEPGWQIVGYADFDQDGQKDIVLQHKDQSVAFWFLNRMAIVRAGIFYHCRTDGGSARWATQRRRSA
jgi:hypothetical protein